MMLRRGASRRAEKITEYQSESGYFCLSSSIISLINAEVSR